MSFGQVSGLGAGARHALVPQLEDVKVFAYGSNLCEGRLRERVPSGTCVAVARLTGHDLRYHKRSGDGSAKADAFKTGDEAHEVWGVVYEVSREEKECLDAAEGLGRGYGEKEVVVVDREGREHTAWVYVATEDSIDGFLRPYSWYLRFVVEGARQRDLPVAYVERLASWETWEDGDHERDKRKRAIEC